MKKRGFPILIFVAIFSVIAIGISLSSTSKGADFPDAEVKIAVINEVKDDALYDGLYKFLDKNFKIKKIGTSEKEIKKALLMTEVGYVLRIRKDRKLTYYAYSNLPESIVINNKVQEYLSTHKLLEKYEVGKGKDLFQVTDRILKNHVKVSFPKSDKETKLAENLYGYFNTLSYILMAIIITVIFVGQDVFSKANTRNRIGISKTSLKAFNIRMTASSLIFILGIWGYFVGLFFLCFGKFVMKSPMIPQFLFTNFIYGFTVIGFAVFVATISKNAEMNAALSNIFGICFSSISGVFIPLEFLPEAVKKVAIISPMYWANLVYTNIMAGKFLTAETFSFLAVELLMGFAVFSVALVLRRNKALKTV